MAAKSRKRKAPIRKFRPIEVRCPYCKDDRTPDYKNPEEIAKYINDRGKILPKTRTGLCAKHQRRLSASVKRARHLGLLPFTGTL